jgi:hypothetical protein
MKCPRCGSEGPFGIEISAVYLVSDEGVIEQIGDNEWTPQSYCECRGCYFSGNVEDFEIKEETANG